MKHIDCKIDQEKFVDLSDSPRNKSRFLGLAIMILLMASVTTGFANFDISKLGSKDKIASPQIIKAGAYCSATPTKITLIADHSSSVVDPAFGGSWNYVTSVDFGLKPLII